VLAVRVLEPEPNFPSTQIFERKHQAHQPVRNAERPEFAPSQTLARHLQSTVAPTVLETIAKNRKVTRGDFMKNQMFALIGLGLLLATASAYAQTGVLKANVPFNFMVSNTQFPAGEYRVHPLGVTGSAMTIQSPDGKYIQAFLPNACSSPQPQKTSKLIFHRYGSQYFLAEIWESGNDRGRELPRSGRESETAQGQVAGSVVVVATLR
jgi:hypothetical protein